jgi:hypothetical protein
MTDFAYKVGAGGQGGRCTIETFIVSATNRQTTVVVVSEHPDNPGMSITNAAEYIATQFAKAVNLDPGRCIWIEHYPAEIYRDFYDDLPSYDLITFSWERGRDGWAASAPDWCRVSERWVNELTCGGLYPFKTERILVEE